MLVAALMQRLNEKMVDLVLGDDPVGWTKASADSVPEDLGV